MSTAAQEEFDRYISSNQAHSQSHPEDRNDFDNLSTHSSVGGTPEEEKNLPSDMSNTATTRSYHIPYKQFDANTGPKGVIADAQSYSRAKQSTFRKAFTNITNTVTLKSSSPPAEKRKLPDPSLSGGSDEDDEDEDFMRQWRANRLAELSSTNGAGKRRVSPSKRTWGSLEEVDANGYLDAVEKVGDEVAVVVCIYDPESQRSAEVEDTLSTLAYKYSTTRFVKLHHEIAEMNHIEIPAILAYRRGDVFATLSGCWSEGLEATLMRQGILS